MLSSSITTLITLFFSLFGAVSFMNQGAAVANTSATIANEAPIVLTLSMSGHNQPSSANQRAITFTGTVEDLNGDIDINNVSLAFFRNNGFNTNTCTVDPNNCYHVTSCMLSYPYGNDTTLSYNCFITIDKPYAYGDWKAVITATDQSLATGARSLLATVIPLDEATTTPAEAPSSGTTGSLPQEEETIEEETAPQETLVSASTQEGAETSGTATVTEETSNINTAGVDRITQFYNRIEKNEPRTRGTRTHTESYGEPLIVAANNTGLAVFDLSTSATPGFGTTLGVIVEIPAGASKDWITIYVDPLGADQFPARPSAVSTPMSLLTAQAAGIQLGERTGISPVGFTVFHVYARDSHGNEVPQLSAAARITLVLPEDLNTKENLGLYRLDRDANTWVEYTFEGHDNYTLSFKSTELGVFALFDTTPIDQSAFPEQVLSKLTCLISILILIIILVGLIILLIVTLRRNHDEDGKQKKAPLFRSGYPENDILPLP